MLYEGVPAFFRSDNDGEMAAKVLRHRLSGHDEELTHHARIILEERCGCFNRKPRSESLNGATFYSLREVKEVIEQRRIHKIYDALIRSSDSARQRPSPLHRYKSIPPLTNRQVCLLATILQ
jgi:hypothetical protein